MIGDEYGREAAMHTVDNLVQRKFYRGTMMGRCISAVK